MTFDLLCMGRAAVDLYAEQIGTSLEKAAAFAKYVGGCPANIAIGSSRLGLKCAMLSRVGDEAMGRFVRSTMIKEGVDVSHLYSDPSRLTGLVFLGIQPPDHFPLIFYRENCADMALCEEDFSAETFARTRAFLITGTHCSNERIFAVTKKAVYLAKEAKAQVILDIDYRPVLWGACGHGRGEERSILHTVVSKRLSELFALCDLIVGTEEEILAAVNKEEIEEALAYLRKKTAAILLQKRGEKGCIAYPEALNRPIYGKPFPVDVLNVLGAGDAFMSGFLRGYLHNFPLERCCDLANANGALVVTRHGCAPAMPYWQELTYFMQNSGDFATTHKLHNSHGRKNLFLLAFDHRLYFKKLEEKYHIKKSEIEYLKSLIYKGWKKALPGDCSSEYGLIIDEQYGSAILQEAELGQTCLVRCIEEAKGPLLHFLGNKEPKELLLSWPKNQIVKVLCGVTSNPEHNQWQIRQLSLLQQACTASGHRYLLELIDREGVATLKLIHQMIDSCYKAKVTPDWWKLPPLEDMQSWEEIAKTIDMNDPDCSGILLLGGNSPLQEVSRTLRAIKQRQPKIRGFAVGRAVWAKSVQKWIQKKQQDQEVIDEVANNFQTLITSWFSHEENSCRV